MYTKILLTLAVVYTQSVRSSVHHGPLALPVVLHSGYLADTPEVAAAKSAHLATLSKQSHGYSVHAGVQAHHGDYRYHGPIAVPHVLHDGHIADTHEVAAAKAEHFAAVAKAQAHGHGHSGHYDGGYDHQAQTYGHDLSGHYAGGYDHHVTAYHGPLAKPVVLPSGYLADTHDVAAAKQQHLHLLHSSHTHHHSHY